MYNQRKQYDICIIGGGINGCGIARDAAGRGLSVLLCEQDDLASGTSSKSSKLIHGGLRYLENYQFRLVREALKEREILLRIAPHLIHELRFILPHEPHLRPRWLLRLGLFIYDHLAWRKTIHSSHSINLNDNSYGTELKSQFKKGFIYSDCWVDDARLVIANAMSARELGAEILTRTRCTRAIAQPNQWQITLDNGKEQETINAKVLINASGPWINKVISHVLNGHSEYQAKLVKGSHIIVPRLYAGDHAYILQNNDKRIVFAIPYERDLTLIGTTEEIFDDDPKQAKISQAEITYLCQTINRYFNNQISTKDIIWDYAGVRPLYGKSDGENLSAISRDYVLELQETPCPLINIFGGKITTYRQLATHALQHLQAYLPTMKSAWTAQQPLPGGHIKDTVTAYLTTLKQAYDWLPTAQLERYFHCYGTEVYTLLQDCLQLSDLGIHFAADLYEQEVRYLVQYEWAKTADDILWRRTKLGLQFNKTAQEKLQMFLDSL